MNTKYAHFFLSVLHSPHQTVMMKHRQRWSKQEEKGRKIKSWVFVLGRVGELWVCGVDDSNEISNLFSMLLLSSHLRAHRCCVVTELLWWKVISFNSWYLSFVSAPVALWLLEYECCTLKELYVMMIFFHVSFPIPHRRREISSLNFISSMNHGFMLLSTWMWRD